MSLLRTKHAIARITAFWGMLLWGLGFSAQSCLMKAMIGNMISKERRGATYGIFNAGFGGSVFMGVMYDISLVWMVIFSVVSQCMFVPLFIVMQRKNKK